MKLLISATTIQGVINSLNDYFYSTTYNVKDGVIVWKGDEVKEDLLLKESKGRFRVYHNSAK